MQYSFRKTFAEQRQLLLADKEVPLARVVITAIVIHFLAATQRLFPDYWVRCADVGSDGYRVDVGMVDFDGLHISYYWEGQGRARLGLASAVCPRKS